MNITIQLYNSCCCTGWKELTSTIKYFQDKGYIVTKIPIQGVLPKKKEYYNDVLTDDIIREPYLCIDGKMIKAYQIGEYLKCLDQ